MNKLPINHSFTGFRGFKYSLASTVVSQAGNKRAVYDKRRKVLLKEKMSLVLLSSNVEAFTERCTKI